MTIDTLPKAGASGTVSIRSVSDISAALGASYKQNGIVIAEADLCSEFFDLRTGLAGEVLQKFVNYRARLAIIVADARAHGERFGELVHEHRTHPVVRFFESEEEARRWLGQT